MATMGPTKPKHMYSWWWDSHISPKNSKWLQENLTDMDAKVTQMIKLIEEDADSFARRAEMYYKKRPELMKMVEEFYRAYRALAERYDNATGVIRQAHRTMAEAFPNQVPPFQGDESPAASTTEGDPRTPDVSPFRLSHGLDESQKDAARHTSATKRNGTFSQESNTVKRGLKEFDDLLGSGGRARKGLNFQDEESHERDKNDNGNHVPKGYVESERFSKAELEISALKNALSKLEAEKEASHRQYQQTLEKFSSLESEVSRMTKDSSRVGEQARKANEEAQHLKDALAKLETEREDAMVQLQQYMDKISNLEISLSHEQQGAAELHVRAGKAEAAADSLKQETARLEVEKKSALLQHDQLLGKVSETEAKLLQAEEDARKAIEQAGKAESEAENLRQMLAKITEEKEAAAVQYLQCLETIAALERKLAVAEEEKRKLQLEMDDTVSKFKDAEEKCLLLERSNQSMHFAMESKSQEMAAQREELTVKQQELGLLWSSLQEERLRFVEAETAFQTLQHLHSQSQDELRSLAAEFQKQKQNLGDLEAYNRRLQNEVEHITGENKGLNEVNLSSAMTIQELQARISQLRDTIRELEAEIELRVDQRNALQQEIYCLKEELNELKKNHRAFIEQVESVGFSPVSFVEDVKNLLDENMKLKEDCERGSGENAALMDKLLVTNILVEKNILLENSLSDLNVELEGVRDRVKELEKSCESLQGEKFSLSNETSTLVSQLHAANDHLGRATQKNSSLENYLLETRYELEAAQVNVKGLQDSCSVLENEKSNLTTEKESLILELDISHRKLESLNATFKELEEKHFSLEKDRESMLHEVEGLKVCLGAERLAHEKLQVKSRALEDFNLLLQNEKSDLASAKESLVLKLETSERELASLNANCRELVDKHFSLGKERESMLHELEGLKVCLGGERLEHEKLQVKSRSLEDFNVLLQNEKSVLAAAKESLVLKLETSERDLLNLNARYQDLEKKHFSLEKESESVIQEAEGLKVCLGAERLEHEKLQVKSRSLEDFNLLLQNEKSDLAAAKESLVLKLETAERELASLNANYRELEQKHFSLVKEREFMLHEADGLKASLAAEKHEHATQARISEAQLALQISEMQEKLQQKSQEFDAELEEATNAQIEIFVMEESIRRCVKKNFELLVEFQKLLEASQQSKKLISELQNEKVEQDTQTRSLSEQLNMLREGLYQVLKALDADQLVDDIEEEDKALLSLIVDKLKASQRVLFGLQDDKQKLVVENSLLLTLVRELQLEVATIVTAKTAVDQQFTTKCEQFLLLQASGQKLAETCEELKIKLKEKEQEEAAVKGELRSIQEQLLDLQGAHLNLRDENIKMLEEQRYLMKLVSDLSLEKHDLEEEYLSILTEAIFQGTLSSIFQGFVSESSMALKELSHDVDEAILENGDLKETAILMEGKEAELIQTIEEFRCKLEGLEVIRTDQATQIMKLSGECGQHRQQADSAHEAIQQLEFELQRLQGDSVEMKHMVDMLNNEVQAKAKEIIILESEAEALLGQLQISLFKEALLEGKIYDLADLCSHFEDKNHSSEIEIDQLRERVDIVDAENKEIKSRVSMYAAAFVALKDTIGELENHTTPKRALSEVYGNETKDSLVFEVETASELQTRIKAIEKAVIEKEKLLMLENSSLNSKLHAAMRQIKEERSPQETLQAVGTYEPVNAYPTGEELGPVRPKYGREIYEEGSEVITKDVMLDQVSESSFHRISRRETKKEHSRERLSTDSLGEKEIGIDRLDISKHFSGSRQDGNNKKILERLDSDSGKLTSLELVIQDLKKKVEVAEKNNRKGKGIEYDSVKEQLEESEQAIQRISEMNQKLKKTIEEDPSAFDEKPALTIDQAGLMKRRRISEQARRGSEKVGRLQLEVQKLQYLLAKLDDETKSKVKAKVAETKTSVLLRDFLHGGTRTGPRSKKGRFCSCVRPATTGD